MVAEYTEADKTKILKKVYICGQGMLITSVALLILYFLIYFMDIGILLTPVLLILAGGIFAINTTLAGLQLKGKMSKERTKRLLIITITIWVVVTLIILIFVTFFLPGILVNALGVG